MSLRDSATPERARVIIDGTPGHELVARIADGDQEALGILYRAVHERLWRFAMTLVGDRAIAQDLVQDVFATLWTRRGRLVIREDILVYLFVAVRHRAFTHERHNRVVQRVEEAAMHHAEDLSIVGAPERPPDEGYAIAELGHAIDEAFGTLSPRDRAACLLRWEESLTYAEIGSILGVSAMGAHKIVVRALGHLQALLQPFRNRGGGPESL